MQELTMELGIQCVGIDCVEIDRVEIDHVEIDHIEIDLAIELAIDQAAEYSTCRNWPWSWAYSVEIDHVEIDHVGIDRVGIDRVGIDRIEIDHIGIYCVGINLAIELEINQAAEYSTRKNW